ncbi:MAG: tetratricopeptide repeat protein, partial [Cyanobacteria bacterium]|nr:tetratricopeptide repeat protein [Cyanobacteriota bacterium]
MKRFNSKGPSAIIQTLSNQEFHRPFILKKTSALGLSILSLTLISLSTLGISFSAFINTSWASWEVPNRYNWPTLHHAGEEAYLLKNLPEAEKQLQKARFELDTFGQFNPDLAKTLNILGLVYLEEGRYSES